MEEEEREKQKQRRLEIYKKIFDSCTEKVDPLALPVEEKVARVQQCVREELARPEPPSIIHAPVEAVSAQELARAKAYATELAQEAAKAPSQESRDLFIADMVNLLPPKLQALVRRLLTLPPEPAPPGAALPPAEVEQAKAYASHCEAETGKAPSKKSRQAIEEACLRSVPERLRGTVYRLLHPESEPPPSPPPVTPQSAQASRETLRAAVAPELARIEAARQACEHETQKATTPEARAALRDFCNRAFPHATEPVYEIGSSLSQETFLELGEVADASGARKKTKEFETITRKFGLKPEEPVPPDLNARLCRYFQEFQAVVNWMIGAGIRLLPLSGSVLEKEAGNFVTAFKKKQLVTRNAPGKEALLAGVFSRIGAEETKLLKRLFPLLEQMGDVARRATFMGQILSFFAGGENNRGFRKETHTAEKLFYEMLLENRSFIARMQIVSVSRGPTFERKSQRVSLKERIWRCAAQFAYFAVREFGTRADLIPLCVSTLSPFLASPASPPTDEDAPKGLPLFYVREFPQGDLLVAVSKEVATRPLTPGQRSAVFLRNLYRHLRNLVKARLNFSPEVQSLLDNMKGAVDSTRESHETALRQWSDQRLISDRPRPIPGKKGVRSPLEEQMQGYLRKLSRLLTERKNYLRRVYKKFKALERDKGEVVAKAEVSQQYRPFGQRKSLDTTLAQLLDLPRAADWWDKWEDLIRKTPDKKSWNTARLRWRVGCLTNLQGAMASFRTDSVALERFIRDALNEAIRGMTRERFLRLVFDPRPRWVALGEGSFTEFKEFLQAQVISQVELCLAAYLQYSRKFPHLLPDALSHLPESVLRRLLSPDRPPLLDPIDRILEGNGIKGDRWEKGLNDSKGLLHKLARPVFKKQTIPLGSGEKAVFEWDALAKESKEPWNEEESAEVEAEAEEEEESTAEGVSDRALGEGQIQLSFKAHEPLSFTLQTEKHVPKGQPPVDRYQKVMQDSPARGNFTPHRGTLTLRSGGGLVLAVPFQRPHQPQTTDINQPQHVAVVASVDLGLKTLATVSISRAKRIVTPGGFGRWDRLGEELARYFFDQRYIDGKKDAWLQCHAKPEWKTLSTDSSAEKREKRHLRRHRGIAWAPEGGVSEKTLLTKGTSGNWKRQFLVLAREARVLQARIGTYKRRFKAWRTKQIAENHRRGVTTPVPDYDRMPRYFKLRRAWKRVWRKLQNLHQEMARQIATRLVAICEHPIPTKEGPVQVTVVRLEDLRWVTSSRKWKTGYFLASNQIHSFFGQIQECFTALATRKGIAVELANAYGTSYRCSLCGKEGKKLVNNKKVINKEVTRVKKIFIDKKCDHLKPGETYRLDADLNAARNILTAPSAERLTDTSTPL